MRKIILRDGRKIPPFNEPARELSVLTKPLWLHQRDVLAKYTTAERVVESLTDIGNEREETLIYRDNLYFDQSFIDEFIQRAQQSGKACQVAFKLDDAAITGQALYLQRGIRRQGNYYVADLWYYPYGVEPVVRPLVMDTDAQEVGFYHVPTHMSDFQGDLVYNLPTKPFLSIEHWIHILHANIDFGIFAIGVRFERSLDQDIKIQLKLLWRSIMERRQILTSSEIVHVGKGCSIDPTAIIQGPTFIGDNVDIGPGVIIRNCVIGDDVTVDQGSQLMLSVVGNGSFLPFRAALYRSVVMDRCMVAQNSCLQMCVVGRDSFVGAGNTFTDFLLVDRPMRSHFGGQLEETGMTALGSAIGHNVRIGSGFTFYPARMVESDVILFASDDERRVIEKNIYYQDSDHLKLPQGDGLHPQLYKLES